VTAPFGFKSFLGTPGPADKARTRSLEESEAMLELLARAGINAGPSMAGLGRAIGVGANAFPSKGLSGALDMAGRAYSSSPGVAQTEAPMERARSRAIGAGVPPAMTYVADLVSPGPSELVSAAKAIKAGMTAGNLGSGSLAALAPVARTKRSKLFETDPEELGDIPDVPQSSIVTGWARKPSKQYLEQREIAEDVVRSPLNVERSLKAIRENEAGGRAWYNTNPLRTFAEDVLEDEDLADAMMRGFFARMGPTSINTRMPKNVERALWATAAGQRKVPITDLDPSSTMNVFGKQGHPYYYSAMQPGLKRIEDAISGGVDPLIGGFNPVNQQKTIRFGENLSGNYENVPGDMHETRRHLGTSMGIGDFGKRSEWQNKRRPSGGTGDSPSRAEHDAIEQLHREVLAPQSGMRPAQSMASEWMDMVKKSGGDERIFMQIFNDQLSALAKLQKKSPRKLLTQIIKGTIPRKSLGGAAGLGLVYGAATEPVAVND